MGTNVMLLAEYHPFNSSFNSLKTKLKDTKCYIFVKSGIGGIAV